MRKVRETRRGMLPEAMRLDAIAPVSSLVFGLPAIAAAAASPTGTPEERREVPTRRHARAELDRPTFKPARSSRTFDHQARSARSLSSLYVANVAQTRLNAAVASNTFFASLKPSVDAANPLPFQGPETAASGSQPRSSGASLAPSAAPVPSPAHTPAVASDSDGIRPMTVAPIVSGSRPIPTPSFDTDTDEPCTAVYPSTCGCGGGSTSGSTSGSSGGGGGGSGSGTTPSLQISGGGTIQDNLGRYTGVVGGQVVAIVYAAASHALKDVTWTIDGGIRSQSYTVSSGTTDRISSPIVNNMPNPVEDHISFFWNEESRTHTINVSVDYLDGTSGNVSASVSVGSPTGSLTRDYQGYGFMTKMIDAINYIGFFQSDPGNVFTASVTTTDFGGTFAFLQTIQFDLSMTFAGVTGEVSESTPGYVLDYITPDMPNPDEIMLSDKSFSVGTHQTNAFLPPIPLAANAIQDNPRLVLTAISRYPNGNYPTAMSETSNYHIYLMYQSPNGIWIALCRLGYARGGNATFNNPIIPDPTAFGRTTSWTVTRTMTLLPQSNVPEIVGWETNSKPFLDDWNDEMNP